MTFRFSRIGVLIAQNPPQAARELERLFTRYGTRRAVAHAIPCSPETIRRWIQALQHLGLEVQNRHGPGRPPKPIPAPPRKRRTKTGPKAGPFSDPAPRGPEKST